MLKVWGRISQRLDGDGFYSFEAGFFGGASPPTLSPDSLILLQAFYYACRIFLIDSHFLSLRIDRLSLGLGGVGFRPAAFIRPTVRGWAGVRPSVTPSGGVWRRFSGEISQAPGPSADFVV